MMTFLSGHKFVLVFLTLTTAFSHIIITDDSLKIISHNIGKIFFSKKKKHSCILSHLLVMICLLLITLLMFFRDLN